MSNDPIGSIGLGSSGDLGIDHGSDTSPNLVIVPGITKGMVSVQNPATGSSVTGEMTKAEAEAFLASPQAKQADPMQNEPGGGRTDPNKGVGLSGPRSVNVGRGSSENPPTPGSGGSSMDWKVD